MYLVKLGNKGRVTIPRAALHQVGVEEERPLPRVLMRKRRKK
jgi:hypothetical protein